MDKNKSKRSIMILFSLFIGFPIVIQILFCLASPHRFLEAKWSAGEILTYAGTVFLGVIAIWQNERLKEANDISQKRLAELASEANKLSFMAKVVEYELGKKQNLEMGIDLFQDACSSQNLIRFVNNNNSINLQELLQIERSLDEAYLRLCFSLGMHYDENAGCLTGYKKSVKEMNDLSKDLIRIVKEDVSKNANEDKMRGEQLELSDGTTMEIRKIISRLNKKRLDMEMNKIVYLQEKKYKLESLIYSTDVNDNRIISIY